MFDLKYLMSLPCQVRLSNGTLDHDNLQVVRKWINGTMQAELKNVTGVAISVREVALLYGYFPVAGSCPFYSEGFHMLSQHGGTLSEPYNIGEYGTDESFFRLRKSPFSEDLYTAYSLMLLSPTQYDRALMAFSSCHRFMGEFRFKNNYIEIVMDCEDIAIQPGETWRFEEFCVFFGQNRDVLFGELAEQINKNHPPRKCPEIPFGWCSYHAISGIKANEIYNQARAMKKRIPELKRIQIDDGYQSATDWLIPNPAAGAATKEICAHIREIGCEPAMYMAPFVVSKSSKLFREHPEWLVMDSNHQPSQEHCFNKDWYILDGTHPEAVAYIREVFRTMYNDWGIRYFKLDFTSYGALPGVRYDTRATRIEAFRSVFIAINEEVGKDSYILGCNAPFWAQLGLVDGNRATSDVFRRWEQIGGNMRELTGRSWQNGRLWINDPDGVVLDKRDRSEIKNGKYQNGISQLTDAEFEYHKAYIIASGGVVTSGDLLDTLSDDHLDVLHRMMAVAGDAAVYDDDTFEIGRIIAGDKHIICVFNHADDVKSIAIPLSNPTDIVDFWNDELLGHYADHFTLFNMAPHSARVLKLDLHH
ncbi:MAG: glycoside hydrolase family 36 protein [Christensenellales bacterium]|jgi:alpha-galactosidase